MVRFLLLLAFLLAPFHAAAQVPGLSVPIRAEAKGADGFGRSTPRGTVQGFLDAVAAADYGRAARYLESEKLSRFAARQRVRAFRTVLDRSGAFLPTPDIANVPEGRVNDGLDAALESVGTFGGREPIPLLLQRVEQDGQPIWLFSAQTLEAVPGLLRTTRKSTIRRFTPEPIKDVTVAGAPLADWLAIVLVAFGSLFAGYAVVWLATRTVALVWSRTAAARTGLWLRTAQRPLALLLGVAWFKGGSLALGVSVIAREWTGRFADVVAVVAFVWLVTTVIDHGARVLLLRSERRAHASATSALRLVKRVATTLTCLFGVIVVLDIAGVDVTTGLAALGIGGIALALGAQKTIENLVGSVTLVADQPIRVGDFCQFEGVLGTVEDIGMRSTRVRTLERTVVTIPNGAFSSMQIENFSKRERFLFKHMLGVRYETTTEQLETGMDALRLMLEEHPQIADDTVRVRFLGFGAHSLDIELYAYALAEDWNGFLEVQEALLMDIKRTFEALDLEFAFASQTVYLSRDGRPGPRAVETAGDTLRGAAERMRAA